MKKIYVKYRAVDPHSFFADPAALKIRIQLNKICKKINSWRVFFGCKKHKRLVKSKKQ